MFFEVLWGISVKFGSLSQPCLSTKSEIFLDDKAGNLVQTELVRRIMYRFTSVDSGFRAPILNSMMFQAVF